MKKLKKYFLILKNIKNSSTNKPFGRSHRIYRDSYSQNTWMAMRREASGC
jgi:hypothetical protein